jgi:hypothetical protein
MAVAAATAGCDAGDPSFQPIDAPPLQLVEVRATTGLDDDFQPVRTALNRDGSTQVLTTASFIVKFDRFLLPSSAIRQSVCLQADLGKEVLTLEDCTDPVFLEPTYNPVRREVIFRQPPEREPLARGTTYVLTVLKPADDDAITGFRAFDRAPLAENVRIQLSTVSEDPPQAVAERPPSADLFCKREPQCVSTCAGDDECSQCSLIGAARYLVSCAFGAACHSDGADEQGGRGPAAGLNLSMGNDNDTIDFIQATAVARVAHQTQMGEHADEPDKAPLRFGRAMPIIDPQSPGNSYLLYKMLVGPNAVDPTVTPEETTRLVEELDRLRASVIVGMPMPPPLLGASFKLFSADEDDPALITHVDGMDILTAWIAQGARLRNCQEPPFN